MADEFVYRADPPAALVGTDDLATLARAQEQAGLNVITNGRPVTAEEIRKSPDDAVSRLSRELAIVKGASPAPVKLCLPLPGALNLDPMLLAGLMANLIDEGATILELDGASYVDPASDASNDGFTLMNLPRPEGFRLAIHMGALSDWSAVRIAEVAEELQADRYVFTVADDDDLTKLTALPGEALAVLGLVNPAGGQQADEILAILDRADEAFDQNRMALTTRGGFDGQSPETQAKVLRQVADLSVAFWGFAI